MKKNGLIITFLAALLLAGCSTKRTYFEAIDENITAQMKFDGNLPSKIKTSNIDVASLEKGGAITKSGVNNNIKLDKDEILINAKDGNFITTTLKGILKVKDANGVEKFTHDFRRRVLSAAINGDDLAAVTLDNSVFLVKMSSDSVMVEENIADAYAVDSRVAAPVFIENLVVYPSLDGLVSIIDRNSGRQVRDFVVSSQPFFNNIIALDIKGDDMYAMTGKRIVLISPSGNRSYNADLSHAYFKNGKIYLFLKDGTAQILDDRLNLLKSKKFTFAIFSGAIFNAKYIYMIEKTGYVIRTNLDLENETVFELDDEIDEKSFVGEDIFYHGDKYIKF